MQELENCKKILIEINQTCNLNCTYCFYRDYGRVSSSLALEDIEHMLNVCPNAEEFYLTGGECFTSPNIENIIEKLSKKGKVIVFTNGTVLSQYENMRLLNIAQKVDRFIISFDSFNFEEYFCRKQLEKTLITIKRLLRINPEKVEVKICINNYNYLNLENIFNNLISLGVYYLSVNFVFDIKNSKLKHEVNELKKLKNIFEVIYKYKKYFNINYINTLYDLYINNKINGNFPCIADKEYYYLDCTNKYLICPGNTRNLGEKGDWEKCFTKECANEWEIMYMR